GMIAGMIAGAPITNSITHEIVPGATAVAGVLTSGQVDTALGKGCMVFMAAPGGGVMVVQGLTTLTSLPANYDAGWKKIRRVRTRDYLVEAVADTLSPLIGHVTNSPEGQQTFLANAQGVINKLIQSGALYSGSVAMDPSNPPTANSIWMI